MSRKVEEINPLVGKRISILLERNGKSQVWLAEKLGYVPQHINLLVKGKRHLPEDLAIKICDLFPGADYHWLLCHEDCFISIPCMVGDTVFADFREGKKKKPTHMDLTESYVKSVEIDVSYDEPLFTVVNEQKTDYRTFWKSDFGKEIFTKNQYLDMLV